MNRTTLLAIVAVAGSGVVLGGIFLLGGSGAAAPEASEGDTAGVPQLAVNSALADVGEPQDREVTLESTAEEPAPEQARALSNPEAIISGRVLDGAGEPIPGAVVRLFHSQSATGGLDRSGDAHTETVTATDGTYRIASGERVWRYILEANAEGYGTNGDVVTRENWLSAGALRATVDITLQPAAELAGKVIAESGDPIEGMLVLMSPLGGDPGNESPRAFGHEEVTSDAEGRFAFATAGEGMRYTVGVEPEERWAPVHVLTEAPDEEIVLELSETGAVFAGIVIEKETERPIAEAVVTLRTVSRGSRPFSNAGYPTYTTASDGAFRFERMGAGTYRVTAESDRYPLMDEDASRNLRAALKAGDHAPAAEIVLMEGITIRGVVLERMSDEPVEGARVTLSHNPDAWDYSDAEGRFELTLTNRGQYTLLAEKEGFAPTSNVWNEDTVVDSSNPVLIRDKYTIRMVRGVTVRGTVTDEEGHPVQGVRLSRYALGESLSFDDATNAAGEYEIMLPVMSEGDLRASVDSRTRGVHPNVRVGREPLDGIDIQFEPDGEIHVSVRDTDGNPVEGVWLGYESRHDSGVSAHVSQHSPNRNISNEEGHFEPVRLAVGSRVMFSATHSDFGESDTVMREIRASDNEPVELTLGGTIEIHLHVTDAETGEPITDARFQEIFSRGTGTVRMGTQPQSQGGGTYTFQVSASRIEGIRVAAQGYAETQVPIEVPQQTDYDVALEHEEAKVLLVYVRDAETHEPVEDLELPDLPFRGPSQSLDVDPEVPGLLVMNPYNEQFRGLVTAPGYERAELQQRTLRVINEEEFLLEAEVLLRRTGDFTGIVVDRETREPVPGVAVSVYAAGGVVLNFVANDPIHTTTTDEDGHFSIRPIAASQNKLRFTPPSPYTEFDRLVSASDSSSNDLGTIELDKDGEVEVRLVAEAGAPVVGVPIHLRGQGRGTLFSGTGSRLTSDIATDEEGRALFEEVNRRQIAIASEALTYHMEAIVEQGTAIDYPVGTSRIEIVTFLPEQSSVYFSHSLNAVRSSPYPRLVSEVTQSREDDEGPTVFTTGPIPSGTWSIHTSGNFGEAGQLLRNREVTVGPGETERIDLTEDQHVVTGRVVDEDGAPFHPNRVHAIVIGRHGEYGQRWTPLRDGDAGGFRAIRVDPGEHNVIGQFLDESEDPPVEYRSERVEFTLAEGENHDVGDLVMRPVGGVGQINVRAVNGQTGEAAVGVRLTLIALESGEELAQRFVDDDGRTTFRSLEPQEYRLRIEGASWLSDQVDLAVAGAEPVEVPLAVDPAAGIRVSGRRADGLAVTKLDAELVPLELDFPSEVQPGKAVHSSQLLSFSGVVPGRYEVHAHDADGASGSVVVVAEPLEHGSGQQTPAEVLLE